MLKSLKKGDKILTHGGLHADVVKVEEDFIQIRLNETTHWFNLDKSFGNQKTVTIKILGN